jgi:hypothetical protein
METTTTAKEINMATSIHRTRIRPGVYAIGDWRIMCASPKNITSWYVFKTGTLTHAVWLDENAEVFWTFNDAMTYAIECVGA